VAVLSFAKTDADTVALRKAIFRMILSRAKERLSDPADIEELDLSEVMEGIQFHRLDDDQRARLVEAVYEGTQDLKRQVLAGEPTEEEVKPGIEEKLDEILALLSRFRQ
jgi:hypothetical protein